jgi:hypothetical protein
MTNDFILKTMDFASADVDTKDFIYGMMMGMLERVVSIDGLILDKLDEMKKARY